MNYQRIYNQIIERARDRQLSGYRERHHILPRSMGGDDSTENLVELTAREHFICHWLLTKIHPSGHMHYKAIHAFAMMVWCHNPDQSRYKVSSRLYERLRTQHRESMSWSQSGKRNSQFGLRWAVNMDLKETRKFPRDAELPEGWTWGRKLSWQEPTRMCAICGPGNCENESVTLCRKSQTLNSLAQHCGLDLDKKGSPEIFTEYRRVVQMLHDDYHVKKLSIEQIKEKYGYNSNERVRRMFWALDISLRSPAEGIRIRAEGR